MIGILARLGRAKAAWSYANALRVKAGLNEVLPSHRMFGSGTSLTMHQECRDPQILKAK